MEGYHKISRFMGQYDDCAIFKKFYELNMQNLLYYQAEIVSLGEEFNEIAQRDMQEPGRALHHRNWESLSWSPNEEDMEQWKKWLEIRQKLKEYSMKAMTSYVYRHGSLPSNIFLTAIGIRKEITIQTNISNAK